MDLAMPKDDYLSQLLTNMQSQLNRIEGKTDAQSTDIAAIKSQTQATQQGLEQAQKDIKKLETAKGKKININSPVLYLVALATVISLFIVASLLGINLKGLI